MTMYDGAKHTALEAEKARLQTEISAVATRMNDEYESDAWDGEDAPGKMARYNADNIKHATLSRELESVDREIERQERFRPLSRSESRSPMIDLRRRWCMGGSKKLDEGERQMFVPEMTREMQKSLEERGVPVMDQEFFDPWALATHVGEDPMPVGHIRASRGEMTASRSDDHNPGSAGTNLNPAAPETWAAGVVESLQYYGSVASNCHNFTTSDGNTFHQNSLDTKDQEGRLLTDQGTTAGTGTPSATGTNIGDAGDVQFTAYWRVSDFIGARIETFQDIHFDVGGRVMREMERRLGRGWNRTFTVGSGATQPEGIAMSALVVDGGAGSADDGSGGIDYGNLLDMEYAIDLAYLEGGEGTGGFTDAHGGMIGWMMNRNVEKQLRFATFPGSAGLPIWVPDPSNVGIATQRAPARILGYPYTINNHMGTGKAQTDLTNVLATYTGAAAGSARTAVLAKMPPLLFGACGHFAVRNVGGPMYYRFWDSETAADMAVKFIGWSRRDSRSRGPHTAKAAGTRSATVNRWQNDAYCILHVKS